MQWYVAKLSKSLLRYIVVTIPMRGGEDSINSIIYVSYYLMHGTTIAILACTPLGITCQTPFDYP